MIGGRCEVCGTNGDGPVEGVFVDFYGTIVAGDLECIEGICAKVIDANGLQMTPNALAHCWGERFFELVEASNGDSFRTLAECEFESMGALLADLGLADQPDEYIDEAREYWRTAPAYPDAVAMLSELGVPVCIVSNADEEELHASVANAGLAVDHVVTSERARYYKPAPEIFEIALRETGWSADRVLHVGDSRHSDVAGAQSVGIRAVWMHRPIRVSDVDVAQPEHTVRDFHELGVLLDDLGRVGRG